jgi:adenine-specific DNA-methyltransferase
VSRLTDLIADLKTKDPQAAADLEREFRALSSRLPFGLNFERHRPEAVELPQRPVRKGDKVRVLPPRGSTARGDQRLWQVIGIATKDKRKVAELSLLGAAEPETQSVAVEDLVVVAEFKDTIYPGLVSTGKVERGGDKPYHTVINAENYHALETLTWTHRGKVDAIYIDPPYNTGAKDWKYNNDYVEGDDLYRHSKWLAFMERRLLLVKELLNPADSVLIVTIDEKEVHRLGLLLEQLFPESRAQMVTYVINAPGQSRLQELARVEEYAYFLFFGAASPAAVSDDLLNEKPSHNPNTIRWESLLRSGTNSRRADRPALFYPVFIDPQARRLVSIGDSKPLGTPRSAWQAPANATAVWPLKSDGTEGNWRASPEYLRRLLESGHVRLGEYRASEGRGTIWYLGKATIARIASGEILLTGRDDQGAVTVLPNPEAGRGRTTTVKTVWNRSSHHAGWHGSAMVRSLIPGRVFPFPKSLYVVEDALRVATAGKSSAIILDFFAGSGTTAHAVMRLNRQDDGTRQSISVTNNEVGAAEQKTLRERGLRPGDPDWEGYGISENVTKARIAAAITGKTPDGDPIKGEYKFTDEFPMSEGFEENAEFFTLTYETPVAVSHNMAFARIAPLLWMRAGSRGRRIDKLPSDGWAVVETYGLLTDLDQATPFLKAVRKAKEIRIAYIVTDDERRFQALARRLPEGVEAVRLYESYLTNFAFANGSEA